MRLRTDSQGELVREMSLYNDSLTPDCVVTELGKLKTNFDTIDAFIDLLSERLIANNFTNKRLRDAVGYLIDNFKYQKPKVSDIIGFDKKIRIYTHSEAYSLIERGEVSGFKDFEMIEINGGRFRIKKSDKINLGYSG